MGFGEDKIKMTLFKKIEKQDNGCWHFTGAIKKNGYGSVYFRGSMKNAHRVAYILTYGNFPQELFVCHKCDNRKCINPEHLFLGTAFDNTHDMIKKGRFKVREILFCKRGHPRTPDNLYIYRNNKACRICRRLRKLKEYKDLIKKQTNGPH